MDELTWRNGTDHCPGHASYVLNSDTEQLGALGPSEAFPGRWFYRPTAGALEYADSLDEAKALLIIAVRMGG